jgi:hypothetical protein
VAVSLMCLLSRLYPAEVYKVLPALRMPCLTRSRSAASALWRGQSVSPGSPSCPQVRHGLRNRLIVLAIAPRYRRAQSSLRLSRSLHQFCLSFLFPCPSRAFELDCWRGIHLLHFKPALSAQRLISGIYRAHHLNL